MTVVEFRNLVKQMRTAQKKWFNAATRTQEVLQESKGLERRVDQAIKELESGPSLFDDGPAEDYRDWVPGRLVEYSHDRDLGQLRHYRIKYAPWVLGDGRTVVGLAGIAGGVAIERCRLVPAPQECPSA